METITIKLLDDNAKMPVYKHSEDAGCDLFSTISGVIFAGDILVVPTGISLCLPQNIEAQIRSRSGLAAKYGVTVLNSPGTIDPGYQGEIMVILKNQGFKPFNFNVGDRIAQMVFAPITKVNFECVESHEKCSIRGQNGLGSTGL
jgi:dUTP pyrophosphatase